ncbi:MAG: hypothetical protein PVI01_07885 [Gemmatimonadales bacterium]|jgi:hypothetical protein
MPQQRLGSRHFFGEVRRRRVARVIVMYGAAAFAGIEAAAW